MSESLMSLLSGLGAKFATKTGVLAGVGVLSASGVAAAAVGAPIPVIEEAFESEGPSLVELEEEAVPEEGSGDDSGESEEPASELQEDDRADEQGADEQGADDEGADEQGADDEAADEEGAETDNHGKAVSAAAQSQCGKKAHHDDPTAPDDGELDDDGVGEEEEPSDVIEDPPADDGPAAGEVCGGMEWKNHGEYVSAEAHANRDAKAEARGSDERPGKRKGQSRKVVEVEGDDAEQADSADSGEHADATKRGKGNSKGPKDKKGKQA